MADAKLTALTPLTDGASGDLLYIVDVSEEPDVERQITVNNAAKGITALPNGATWQSHTFTLTGNFIRSGAHALTVTTTATTSVTFPTSGTLLQNGDIGSTVQGYDVDTLKADTSDQLTAGFSAAADDDGTQSTGSYTPSFSTGNYKQATNGGSHTLAPPSPASDEVIDLCVLYINNGSAGTITTSGFTQVTGDSFDTTNNNKFLCRITVYDDGGTEYSLLHVTAMQ